MTAGALLVLAVLAAGCVASWHPAVILRLEANPWWMVAGVPSVVLGLAAILAAASGGHGANAWVADVASVLAVAVAVGGGRAVTDAVLRGAGSTGIPDITHPVEPAAAQPGPAPRARPVMRGGAWIGSLERAAVASCLLVGIPEGVAVVLAIKGLGRYPELRAPGAAERFIIGTFASLLWAGAAAGVALLLR
ncbi:MAG TPA: hypothetical protein VE287_02940 [Actinopolymorphaceae bacterium]|jgi:hypothetical protein|nr:hypothetical protein [Actinopolymorphaceae bacterium]